LKKLRHVIIGVGAWVFKLHRPALDLDTVDLVAVSDIDETRARSRAQEMNCAFYTDHRAMLAEYKPDVAVITTPHPTHAAIALDCLAVGAHVLVEKPMSDSIADAEKMVAAAEKANCLLGVCYQRRFRPTIERARELIANGALGPIVRTLCLEPVLRSAKYYRDADWRGTWRGEGGGVLLNQAPHPIDTLCHLVGMPARITGITRTARHAIECEDTAHALLEYANGASGYFFAGTAETSVKPNIQIAGEKGALELSDTQLKIYRFANSIPEYIATSTEIFDRMKKEIEVLDLPDTTGNHVSVYRDFHAAILEGRQPRANGREGLMSVEFANALIYSAQKQMPVTLPLDRVAYTNLLRELRKETP
jgi:UDP-N-acetyl-2-amino-2-deoxyglucuronate dehydrogenase